MTVQTLDIKNLKYAIMGVAALILILDFVTLIFVLLSFSNAPFLVILVSIFQFFAITVCAGGALIGLWSAFFTNEKALKFASWNCAIIVGILLQIVLFFLCMFLN